jgi:hypothetical protein
MPKHDWGVDMSGIKGLAGAVGPLCWPLPVSKKEGRDLLLTLLSRHTVHSGATSGPPARAMRTH